MRQNYARKRGAAYGTVKPMALFWGEASYTKGMNQATKPFTVVFTGGGSGGHVTPNLALIAHIRKTRPEVDIHYIGTNAIEKKLVTPDKAVFHEISAAKLERGKKNIGKILALPFALAKSVGEAARILKKIRPDVVFSKGGYVGLPVVIAAKRQKIRTISHESDTSLGLANKIAMRFSDLCLSSFPVKKGGVVVSGSPLNQEIYRADKETALEISGINKNKKVLLVTGGSLGAGVLNMFVFENFDKLKKNYAAVLVSGKNKKIALPNGRDFYQTEYTDKLHHFYALADLVLTRAGSNTLCELAVLGVPFVSVPLSSGSRGEQAGNAGHIAKIAGGEILEEKDLNLENFLEAAKKADSRAVPEIDGTGVICDYILGACKK